MKLKLTIEELTGIVSSSVQYAGRQPYNDLPDKNSSDLYTYLNPDNGIDLGFLPPAVRWISDNQRMVVFERPPSIQYVEVAMDTKYNINKFTKIENFNLPIPWTLYFVLFDENFIPVIVNVYCRNEPLYDWEDQLFMLPMLNLYFNSKLCNPVFEKFEDFEKNLTGGIQQAYNMVWNSGWNLDLKDTILHCMSRGIPSGLSVGQSFESISMYFKNWEKLSLLQVLETKWDIPKAFENGSDLADVSKSNTFQDILDHFVNEITPTSGITMREMMVKLINGISVI